MGVLEIMLACIVVVIFLALLPVIIAIAVRLVVWAVCIGVPLVCVFMLWAWMVEK